MTEKVTVTRGGVRNGPNPFKESEEYKRGYVEGLKQGISISWADAYTSRKDTRLLITRTLNRFANEMKKYKQPGRHSDGE